MKVLHSHMWRCEVNVFVEMWMEREYRRIALLRLILRY